MRKNVQLILLMLTLGVGFFALSGQAQAATTSGYNPGLQCNKPGDIADCWFYLEPAGGNDKFKIYKAEGFATVFGNYDSASIRVDMCFSTQANEWDGSCATVLEKTFGRTQTSYSFFRVMERLDYSNWNYVVLHVRIYNATSTSNVWNYARRVSIDSFSSDKTSVNTGESFTVFWSVGEAESGTTLYWDGAVGTGSQDYDRFSDSKTFSSSTPGTATFRLKARGPGYMSPNTTEMDTANPVYVDPNQPRNITVTIVSNTPTGAIDANPTACTKSGSRKCDTTISYTTTNATYAMIRKDGNNWQTISNLASGSFTDYDPSPTTHTYALWGGNSSNANTQLAAVTTTINPEPAPTAPTASISADSTSLSYNGSTTIRWSSTNASSCSVSPPGWSGASGAQGTGSLTLTTTYTVSCSGPGGSASNAVTVSVGGSPPPPPPGCGSISGNQATFVSQSAPSSITAGSSANVSVTMTNCGNTTWTSSGGYKLGSQNPQDNGTWGISRVIVPNTVTPGNNATFNFSVTAPSSPNNYNFQWRMVQEGVMWFGDYTSNVVISVGSPPPPPPPPPPGNVSVDVQVRRVSGGGYTDYLSLAYNEVGIGLRLLYTVSNAASCTATGSWSGVKHNYTDSDPATGPSSPGTYYYGVSCTGSNGSSASDSATVVLASPPGGTAEITFTVTYVAANGTLNVSANNPPGGSWNISGVGSRNGPASSDSVSAGAYTITPSPVAGYNTPASQTATVTSGNTTSVSFNYQQSPGILNVSCNNPPGGGWNISGVGHRTGPTSADSVGAGSYTITYDAVAGYITPSAQTASVTSGNTTTVPQCQYNPATLNAPTNVNVYNTIMNATVPFGSLKSTWDYSSNGLEQRFRAYRSTDGAKGSKIADNISTAARLYLDSTVTKGSSYYYTVCAHTLLGGDREACASAAGPTMAPIDTAVISVILSLSKVNDVTYSTSGNIKTGDKLSFQGTIINAGPATGQVTKLCSNPSANIIDPRNLTLSGGGNNGGITAPSAECSGGTKFSITGVKNVGNPNWVVTFDTTYNTNTTDPFEVCSNTLTVYYTDGAGSHTATGSFGPLLCKTGKKNAPSFREVAP